MKNKTIALLLAGFTVVSVSACSILPTDPTTPAEKDKNLSEYFYDFWTKGDEATNQKFEELSAKIFHDVFQNDGYNLHEMFRDMKAYGFDYVKPTWESDGLTDDYIDNFVKELESIPRGKLSRENQITYQLMMNEFTQPSDLDYAGSSISYARGLQGNLITALSSYEFYQKRDIEDYIDLIENVPALFDSVVETEWKNINAGYGQADFVLKMVMEQCEDVLSEEVCSLIPITAEKIQGLLDQKLITADEATSLTEKSEMAVKDYFLTGYRSLLEEVEKMLGTGKNERGLAGLDDAGKAYYAYSFAGTLGYYGEIGDLFDRMNAYLEQTMFSYIRTASLNSSTYMEWIGWQMDESSKIKASDKPEELMDFFSHSLGKEFPSIGETTYNISYLSENMQSVYGNTLAYYSLPPIDDYKNGAITVNGKICKGAEVITTIAHEGYPGHMYQNVYYLNTNPDPVRNIFTYLGYAEGWAQYAACEAMKFYDFGTSKNSVIADLTKYNMVSSYLLYAISDIGIHYYDWSVEDTALFMDQNGFNGDVAKEFYETIVAMPLVYLDYGAGLYEFYHLRAYAEQFDRFDPYEFHALLLTMGETGFDVMEEMVKEFYEPTKLEGSILA